MVRVYCRGGENVFIRQQWVAKRQKPVKRTLWDELQAGFRVERHAA
jgi:hypothetical protein